jgi:hypothetical protein
MQLTCQCVACGKTARVNVSPSSAGWSCPHCGHSRPFGDQSWAEGSPARCCNCENPDLWRQKDFPQRLGFLMVALGAIGSSIAWGYHYPVPALAILVAFAILDMVLYWIMPDVLVCYRCRARHRVTSASGEFTPYNHELGERYRQERLRLAGESSPGPAASSAP